MARSFRIFLLHKKSLAFEKFGILILPERISVKSLKFHPNWKAEAGSELEAQNLEKP